VIDMTQTKINRMELLDQVRDIIKEHCNDPAEELITLGTAMVDIGKALKGQSPAEARAILTAIIALEAAS